MTKLPLHKNKHLWGIKIIKQEQQSKNAPNSIKIDLEKATTKEQELVITM